MINDTKAVYILTDGEGNYYELPLDPPDDQQAQQHEQHSSTTEPPDRWQGDDDLEFFDWDSH